MIKIKTTPEQIIENRLKLAKILKNVDRPMDLHHIDLLAKNTKNISFFAGYVEYSLGSGRKFRINRKTGEPLNKSEAFNLELETIKQYNNNFRLSFSK